MIQGLKSLDYKELKMVAVEWASLVVQLVKNLPAMWKTRVPSLGWENPLEKGNATTQYSGLEKSMDCVVHDLPRGSGG